MNFTDAQLNELQRLLSWNDGSRLPDGRILGRGRKGGPVHTMDQRIRILIERLQPTQKHILELGSCEGVHTVQLAAHCRRIVGVEARPSNVLCSLVRLWAHGVTNATVVLRRVEELDEQFGRFDILCHIGVLYHLQNPVEHLFKIRRLADTLFLDTHYWRDAPGRRADVSYGGKRYAASLYRERRNRMDAFAGMDRDARWLERGALLSVLSDAGYTSIEIVDDRLECYGPRITIIATRTAA